MHHAAATHDGTVLRLFLDGAEVASTVVGGVVDDAPSVPIAIGAQPPGAGGTDFDSHGSTTCRSTGAASARPQGPPWPRVRRVTCPTCRTARHCCRSPECAVEKPGVPAETVDNPAAAGVPGEAADTDLNWWTSAV